MKNIWIVTIGSGVIVGLALYFIFGIGKSSPALKVDNSPGSINTVGQIGGTNTINNIIASSNVGEPTFKVVKDEDFFLSGGQYEFDYSFTPITSKSNPLIFALDVDKDTEIDSMVLVGEGKTLGQYSKPLLISGDNNEKVNHWLQSYLSVPPVNLSLKIVFSRKPIIYTMQTSALGGH